MTSLLAQATENAQGLLEDLVCAQRVIRRLAHQLETSVQHTPENSLIESLTSIALDAANAGGEWIRDCIDRAIDELADLESATQNAESKIVSANVVVAK